MGPEAGGEANAGIAGKFPDPLRKIPRFKAHVQYAAETGIKEASQRFMDLYAPFFKQGQMGVGIRIGNRRKHTR
jgi:hypothetical protein